MKKEGKKTERKKETSAKYKRPNCYFCLWLVDYSVSIPCEMAFGIPRNS